MDIFQDQENEETENENHDDGQNHTSNDQQETGSDDKREQNEQQETEASLDSDYDIDEYKLDEQLVDTDSDKQSNEQVVQKKDISALNLDYKIFTNQYDEVTKAENLENSNEANKLRKMLDQQLIGFRI